MHEMDTIRESDNEWVNPAKELDGTLKLHTISPFLGPFAISCPVCTFQTGAHPPSACAVCGTPLKCADCDEELDAPLARPSLQDKSIHVNQSYDGVSKLTKSSLMVEEEKCHEHDSENVVTRKARELSLMLSSPQGHAWMLVEAVMKVHDRLRPSFDRIKRGGHFGSDGETLDLVAIDDMVAMAEKFLQKRKQFDLMQKCCDIDVHFHYTKARYLESICSNGLVSRHARVSEQSKETKRSDPGRSSSSSGLEQRSESSMARAYFGPGIYTGSNPFAFQSYGEIGIIVAILKGNSKRVRGKQRAIIDDVDSVVGNKICPDYNRMDYPHYADEVVLKDSAQVLPLMYFTKSFLSSAIHLQRSNRTNRPIRNQFLNSRTTPQARLIEKYRKELQGLMDQQGIY